MANDLIGMRGIPTFSNHVVLHDSQMPPIPTSIPTAVRLYGVVGSERCFVGADFGHVSISLNFPR